jgi:uncharacterized protein (TIGR01777 family)
MNVLISGGTGLIGTALTTRLTGDGHQVTSLVRAGRSRPTDPAVRSVAWEPDLGVIDRPALRSAGPFNGVINLAGAGIGDRRWSPGRKQALLESRTRSTQLLAETLTRMVPLPAVLVSASAIGYYGVQGDEVLTETSPAGTDFLGGLCQAWEAAAQPALDAGIRTVNLRTGVVLSAEGGALAKQVRLFRIGAGGRMGPGTQYRSWITLEDEVGVIVRCLEDPELSGPVNATAPAPATDAELARAIGVVVRRPTLLSAPAPALRLVLGTEMAEELLLGGQRVLPAVLTAHGFPFTHPELDEAVRSVLGGPG